MALKNTALVAYHVHGILLNISARRKKWLMGNGYTLVGFLPVCSGDEELNKEGSAEHKTMPCTGLHLR